MTRRHPNPGERLNDAAEPPVERVTSASNATLKLLRSLDRKKARAETGLFLAEGARLIHEGLERGWRPRTLLAADDAFDRPGAAKVLSEARDAGARIISTTPRLLTAVSKKDNPQTLIAAFEQRAAPLSSLDTVGERRWLALFEVRDPGNLGTILRTADAAGVDGVVLVGQCCDPYAVEAVRASMGSLFAMPFASASLDEFLEWASTAKAWIAAASMNGDVRPDDADYGDKSIVLMGNEQSGLPPDLEAASDVLVRIPMRGGADSLNLAAATAIMTYSAWRARGFDDAR